MKRRIGMICIALLLVTAIGLLLGACGKAENPFVGKWRLSYIQQLEPLQTSIEEVPDDASSIVIKNGGETVITLKNQYSNRYIEGTWTYDESAPQELMVTDADGNETRLTMDSSGRYVEIIDDQEMFVYEYNFMK